MSRPSAEEIESWRFENMAGELERIGDALERIAAALEQPNEPPPSPPNGGTQHKH